jgi:tetratricopeptide (TPR) repeat protein
MTLVGWDRSLSLSVYFRFMGAYDQAIDAGRRALALATASGEVVLYAQASLALGYVYQAQGDYRRAIDCYRETAAFFDGARRHERFGELLPAAISRAMLAACHAELGMFADGRALGDEALRIAKAIDHPSSLMWAYHGIGLLSLRQGDLPMALPLLERALGICQEADLLTSLPWMAAALGEAYTLCGRIADAVPLLTQAVDQSTASERRYSKSLCSLPLGRAHLLSGRLEEAHALAEQALAHASAHQERGHQARALHLLGDIAAHREPLPRDQAEAHYGAALVLADELGMRPLVAHCHLSLGTLYHQMGRSEEAHAALSTAIELYRAMEMTFWLPQAEAALATRGEEPNHQHPAPLSIALPSSSPPHARQS